MCRLEQQASNGAWLAWHEESLRIIAIDLCKIYSAMFPFIRYRVTDSHGRVIWESSLAPIGI